MSSYPYDDICAPRFVNFLSKSPEHDLDRSLFFQRATPFRAVTMPSCSTPFDEACEVEDLNSSSLEDKTITPDDEHQEDISNASIENIHSSLNSNFEGPPSIMPVSATGDNPAAHPEGCQLDVMLSGLMSNVKLSIDAEKVSTSSSVNDSSDVVMKPNSSSKVIADECTQVNAHQNLHSNLPVEFSTRTHSPRMRIPSSKRSRSPVPPSVKDYSLPPEKYISVPEHIAHTSNHASLLHKMSGPNQKSAKSNQLVSSSRKGCKSGMSQKAEGVGQSRARLCQASASSSSERVVRVGLRPQPKVEPFQNTQYKKKPVSTTTSSSNVKEFNAGCQSKTSRMYFRRQDVKTKAAAAAVGTSCTSTTFKMSLEPSGLCQKPFIPKKSTKEPTRPLNFVLRTEQRAHERAQFENQVKEKMIQNQLKKLVEAEENKKKISAEISQIRKNLVFKSRPVPKFRHFESQKSTKPLTEPVTPLAFRKYIKKDVKCMAGMSDEAMDAESLPL